ncbi:Sec-independent protein translocase subunit TatA [Nonomuraea sp. NPDC005983]|uniref:Sec-independent protein translocase subunit TatA n=1 Tax=Nonomuraea sp. NPDC005983 TaxID=3155595 RepID=UPI0033B07E2D
MGSLSPTHWLIVAIAAVLLFGAKKLPDTARSVGRSLRIFKAEVTQAGHDGEQQPLAAPTPSTLTPSAMEEQARQLEEQAARLRAQAAAEGKDKPAAG